MKNLDNIAEELFNKLRGRFPKITIGDAESVITNDPKQARFFDFELSNGEKVNVSLDEESVTVMYNNKLFDEGSELDKGAWYDFLKELRQFSKKRMLNFDTRDITKSNLDKRDYEYLAKERGGETTMSESKMYGTSRTSFQNIGDARMVIKHSEPVNQELASGRSQKIHSIYIESASGERFKYPFKHLNGARAVARHVSEGGNLYDDIGQHIVGLSEELSKLRKFKTYMNRSTVMAEGLSGYMDVVYDRIATVKKTVESLQKSSSYKEFVENFEPKESVEVPEDVQSDWIDQLTIRQFNEELKGVFPYIYKLVSEANAVQELGPDELVDESALMAYAGKKKHGAEYMKKAAEAGRKGASQEELGRLKDKYSKAEKKTKEEAELESAFDSLMGQFTEDEVCEECGNPSWRTLGMTAEEIEEAEKKGLYYYVNKRKKAGTSRKKGHPDAPSDQDWKDAAKTAKKESTEEETNEGKKKGSHGKVCWQGYRRGEGNDCHRVVRDDIEEDAMKESNYPHITNFQELYGIEDEEQYKDMADDAQAMDIDEFEDTYSNVIDMAGDFWEDHQIEEGNEFAKKVRDLKARGGKKGDKFKTSDGEEHVLEKQKTPLGEFILSYFDYTTGQFPKGETAVLTMVEKDYGEQFIEPAKQFIEQINNKVAEVMGYREEDAEEASELERIRGLAGL